MKEIDLLPDWVKDNQKRKQGRRTHYLALGGILLIIFVWGYITAAGLSKASAQYAKLEKTSKAAQQQQKVYLDKEKNISELEKTEKILEHIDSRINIAGILAELSFLINEKIVLNRVSKKKKKIGSGRKTSKSRSASAGKDALSFTGDVKFRITLRGIASEPKEVANLIVLFEDSPYFRRVIPLFSENVTMKAENVTEKEDIEVTQFEIACYLANYEESK